MPISTIKNDGLEGPVPVAKGGTGSTTTTAALNTLLPVQTTATGKVLQSDGTTAAWITPVVTLPEPILFYNLGVN